MGLGEKNVSFSLPSTAWTVDGDTGQFPLNASAPPPASHNRAVTQIPQKTNHSPKTTASENEFLSWLENNFPSVSLSIWSWPTSLVGFLSS